MVRKCYLYAVFALIPRVCDGAVKFRGPAKYLEPSPPSFRRSKRAGN